MLYMHFEMHMDTTWGGAKVSVYINCHSTSCLPARLTFKKVNYISYFPFQSYRQPYQPFKRKCWSWWSSSRQSFCITLFSVSCWKSEVANDVIKWCIFNEVWLFRILRASFMGSLEAYYHSVTGMVEICFLLSRPCKSVLY